MQLTRLGLLCVVVLCASVLGRIAAADPELFVDSHAAPGGSGTATAPFQTISEAVKAAPNGGTIIVKGGIYRETVTIANKKNKDVPLTIQAAAGERVVVTSFDVVQGWKEEGKGLYSLTVPARLNDLYVSGSHARLARFPDAQSPWAKITVVDPAAGTMQLDQFPTLAAGEEKSLCVCDVGTAGNIDLLIRVKTVDPTTKTVTFEPVKVSPPRVNDPVLLFNAPSFLKYPGEWACEQIDEKSWKVVYWPKSPNDLQKTETRAAGRPVVFDISNSSNVALIGLEVSGGGHRGINAQNCDQLQIKRCLIYDNGIGGINVDTCTGTLVDSCVIFENRSGILANSGSGFTMQGCEIAFNEEDGIDYSGRGLQDPKSPPMKDVVLRNNYIHGHIYLGHPDNTQCWGNVDGVTYENNLIMLGGNSSGQLEDCENLKVRNCAMVGSGNYHFNLGTARGLHTAVYNAEFTNDTLALAGSIPINMPKDVHDVKVFNDVFLQNRPIYNGTNLTSGNNIYWSRGDDKDGLIISNREGHQVGYTTIADFQKLDPGFEVNSQEADPQYKNIPVCILRGLGFTTPPNSVTIMKDVGKTFAVGDNIEVCGDGVPRKIDSVNGQVVTFTPPLPSAPFRDLVIWNWGADTNTQIDLTSPVVGGKDQPGSNINVAAFQRGELDGSGKRSLPTLTPEAKAAWPNPSDFVFPYYLYLQGRFD